MKKLNLSQLKVKSFVTSLENNQPGTVKGGAVEGSAFCVVKRTMTQGENCKSENCFHTGDDICEWYPSQIGGCDPTQHYFDC